MDAIQALRQRRTVRNYTGAAIPRQHLETIVDCARLAASGSNQQPWDFIVVTDSAMIQRIKGKAEWIAAAGAVIAVVMDPNLALVDRGRRGRGREYAAGRGRRWAMAVAGSRATRCAAKTS